MTPGGYILCAIAAAGAAVDTLLYASTHRAGALVGAVICGLMFVVNLIVWPQR